MLPVSIPPGPGPLRGFWGKVMLPIRQDAEVTVCFQYLFPESPPGLEKGKNPACCLQPHGLAPLALGILTVPWNLQVQGLQWLLSLSCQTVGPGALSPLYRDVWGCVSITLACSPPAITRALTSAIFSVTHRSWLLHTESWVAGSLENSCPPAPTWKPWNFPSKLSLATPVLQEGQNW